MRKSIITLAALVVGLVGAGISRAQDACQSVVGNIVANCGFETGDFTGWTNTDSVNSFVNIFNVYSGNYAAWLGPMDGTGTLSQTLATTPGDTYAITIALANDTTPTTGYTNSFFGYWGSFNWIFGTDADAFPYTVFTEDLTATSSSTLISFVTENDAGYWDLDSISVVDTTTPPPPPTTPEPGSIALLGTSLLGVAAAARRRFHR